MLPRCILKSRPAKTVKTINNLAAWSQKLLLSFNMGSQPLTPSHHTHITQIVKKANQRICIFKRWFTDLTESKVKTLYQVVERPILEYASPAWNPYTPHPPPHPPPPTPPPTPHPTPHPSPQQKNTDSLEKVQNSCSKLTNLPLSLTSIEDRRRFIDICEVFRYTPDLCKTDQSIFFTYSHTLEKQHSRTKSNE